MTYNYYSNNMGLPFKQQLLDQFTNELQWHSDFTISFLLQGTVNINIQNRGHLLAENDIFFLEPFHSYSVIANSDPVKALSFSIDYEFIRHLCPDIDSIALSTNYLRYKSNTDLHVMISKNIGQIILHTMKHGSCDKLKCLSAISNILTLLIDSFGTKQAKTDIPANYTQNRIKEIIEYINENYAEKVTLQTISSQLGIHPQYFSTFFKKHFRKNFVEYLTDFRILHSLSTLSNTSDSILDIAISHGFNNHKTYSTAFKKLYNVSPTEFRKELTASRHTSSFATTQDGYFYFFQKFWNNEDDNNLHKKIGFRHICQ